MSGPHEATLSVTYPTVSRASVVERSVAQEQGEIKGNRTTATVARDGRTLQVRVSADDLIALRAGCNTWTSLVGVAAAVATPGDR